MNIFGGFGGLIGQKTHCYLIVTDWAVCLSDLGRFSFRLDTETHRSE